MPKPAEHQPRKPPFLPTFDSKTFAKPRAHTDEVFYTDPAKASEDLKALLEGGIEEDEEVEDKEQETEPTKEASQGEKTADGESTQTIEPRDTIDESKTTDQKPSSKDKLTEKDRRNGYVKHLKVRLLPHQVAGVKWMRNRELGPVQQGKVPKGGILADDMGLGKTLQTVSVILSNLKPTKEDESYQSKLDKVEKTTLVVAPLALIRQWEAEMKGKVDKECGLKVLVHHGPQRTKRYKDLALYDVVITTYQILVSDYGASVHTPDGVKAGCFGLHWWRIVLDEAHTIKNRNAKTTKACCALRSEYRWCLSGTPMQNNLDELQSLIHFLRIKPYDDYKEWKLNIDGPMKNGKGHIAIKRLHTILRCFMKRRTKAILKKDGALNPGGRPSDSEGGPTSAFKVTERKVVTITAELSTAERRFYDRVEARASGSLAEMMNEKVNYASAFTLLLRLRQVCNHPKLVEGKLDKDKDAWSRGDPTGKKSDTDVDGMIDMFAGMDVAAKSCSICGAQLTRDQSRRGDNHCSLCKADLEQLNNPELFNRKSKKETKGKSKVKSVERKLKLGPNPAGARKARNRKVVVDSDDEDEEGGSWLVGASERGNLQLGKAGGEEDENAEGGGDSVLTEERSTLEQDGDLSSFVVSDDVARKEDGYRSVNEASDSDTSDESLLSVSALTQKMAAQTLDDKKRVASKNEEASSTEEESGSEADDDSEEDSRTRTEHSDSGIDASELYDSDHRWSSHRSKPSPIFSSAKIRELIHILQREVKEHKFIVFSQFTSMLDLVEPFLRKQQFKYTRYDGSMRNDEREESLRRLREDKRTRILLCSLKCGSLGLNLTAATRVVILEPFWNPVSSLFFEFIPA